MTYLSDDLIHEHADRNQLCEGSRPVDHPVWNFIACPNQAVCTWNGISLCEECAEDQERGLCDFESARLEAG